MLGNTLLSVKTMAIRDRDVLEPMSVRGNQGPKAVENVQIDVWSYQRFAGRGWID